MFDSNSAGVFRGQRIDPVSPEDRVGILHVVSGSFNPLHDAHRWMYESIDEEGVIGRKYAKDSYAIAATTSAKYFEISTSRVGKEDLKPEELMTRLRQFSGYAPVLVTEQSLFVHKYEVLKSIGERIVFHLGLDTFDRLLKAQGHSEVSRYGCMFCVWSRGGRWLPKGAPANCYSSDLEPPSHLADLSSTRIRAGELSPSGKRIT